MSIYAVNADQVFGQAKEKFTYAAQKKFIHPDLGKVYLGMPLQEFAKHFDLSKGAVGDPRFRALSISIPVNKANVDKVIIMVEGLEMDGRETYLKDEEIIDKEDPNFIGRITRLDAAKAPDTGFVYQISVHFKPEFDLRSYVLKTFGKKGSVREPDDEYHFYDIQWAPKTSDGLGWLVRSFHEGDSRILILIGLMKGTQWDPDAVD